MSVPAQVPPPIPCLDENGVALYLAEETRDDEREAVRAHLEHL